MELARVVVVCSPQPTTLVTFASERMNSQELECSELEGGQQQRQQSVSRMSAAPQSFVFSSASRQDVLAGRTGCCQSATVVAQRTFVVTPSGAGDDIAVG